MACDSPETDGVDRRTVLERIGAGSLLAVGGAQRGAATTTSQREPAAIPAGSYRPDTSHLPAVDDASVVVHEGGSVATHLSLDGDRLAERGRGQPAATPEARTVSTYSIGLELPAHDRRSARALQEGRPEDAGLRAAVGRRERDLEASLPAPAAADRDPGRSGGSSEAAAPGTGASNASNGRADASNAANGRVDASNAANGRAAPSSAASTSAATASAASSSATDQTAAVLDATDAATTDIEDDPVTGSRDYAAFGQTESQECGPLARTTVLSDAYEGDYGTWFYNTTDERESVDGDACAGDRWDATFEAFCDYLGFVPGYDCGVPSAFDTNWNVYSADRRGTRAGTVFTCGNFPAIPDTVVSAHEVELTEDASGVGVEFDSVVGVAPYNDVSDYGFDVNGISNAIVDGLATLFPGLDSVYSYALATYLLKHDAAVVT